MKRRLFIQNILASLGAGLCAHSAHSILSPSLSAAEQWDSAQPWHKNLRSEDTEDADETLDDEQVNAKQTQANNEQNNTIAPRWGMAIFLEKLTTPGLIESITMACHKAHNVPSIPLKNLSAGDKSVKWIWQEPFERTFYGNHYETLSAETQKRNCLVMCNHCDNPPCVRVCPTGATFKSQSGLVMMDYHRCIGCRYCMAACPYGARSFNYYNPRPYIADINTNYPTRMRGVVEKCSFCVERLAKGLLPYCVEASSGALVFGNLNDPESDISVVLMAHTTLVRKPSLGTGPNVYYVIA